jgi:hypothetical protein
MERIEEEDMNIHEFRSKLGPTSLAKNNRFMVNIFPVPGLAGSNPLFLNDLRFMASDAQMAGRTMETETFRYYGPSFDAPIITNANDIQIMFYTKEGMDEYKYFHAWMDFIQGDDYNMRWMNEYVTQVRIDKLSEVEGQGVKMSVIYNKVYPVAIADTPLSWMDEEMFKTSVTFTYVDYTIV